MWVSLYGCSRKEQLLLLTLDEGYLLMAAPPDLECGVAPLHPPAPAQPLLLRYGVAPLGCSLRPPATPDLTSNNEEAEAERFYEDLQDLLELKPKKDVLVVTGDWNAKVGSQETHGVIGRFGLGVRNEAGQRLIEFCQEYALVIANTLFQQHKIRLYMWTSPDGQH